MIGSLHLTFWKRPHRDRKQMTVCQGLEVTEGLTTEGLEVTFWDVGTHLYVDCGGVGYTVVCFCSNS